MSSRKTLSVFYLVGAISLIYSIYSALILHGTYFYTFFAFGSWLVFDLVDYAIRKHSLLNYFLRPDHRDAFIFALMAALISFFIVDYELGVNLSGMWKWTNINNTWYLISMFLIMNASFVFSMYELHQIIRSLIKFIFGTKSKFNKNYHFHKSSKILIILGLLMVVSAFSYFILGYKEHASFVMILPFFGMFLIIDMSNYILGGPSLLFNIIKLNFSELTSLVMTTLMATFITEWLNLFSNEWTYVQLPFRNITFLQIPLSLYIGWFGLILLSIGIIDLIQRIDKIKDDDRISFVSEIRKRR